MLEIETETIYETMEEQDFLMYYSGDGFDDPLYWDFLIRKYLPSYKE
ncbi:MAG: hypothetical protein ACFFA8_03955 [Promethearchaeota archaeon]